MKQLKTRIPEDLKNCSRTHHRFGISTLSVENINQVYVDMLWFVIPADKGESG